MPKLEYSWPLRRALGVSLTLLTTLPAVRAAAAETDAAPAAAASPKWEGAIGLIGRVGPEYEGASRQETKISPGFYLRYGRLTVTNASGFRTRKADEVPRGATLALVQKEGLRVNLAARLDRGRDEGSSAAFQGLGDIKPTVRAQISAEWRVQGPWSLTAGWSVDALGRGGGNGGDVGLTWEHRYSPDTVFNARAGIGLASDRYMQTRFGISEEQAQRSGRPIYTAGSGLRDVHANLGFRTELSKEWFVLGGITASRLLGPAADSPLTTQRNGVTASVGLAWRF